MGNKASRSSGNQGSGEPGFQSEVDQRLITLLEVEHTKSLTVAPDEENERLITLLEAERAKIAREIHDEAGQLLVAATFRLDQVIAMLPKAFVARDLLEQAKQSLDECAEELQRLAFNLRPRMLDDLGLLPALRSYLKRYSNLDGIEVKAELQDPPIGLASATELTIFRIVQEAIANVRKHSRATHVAVSLAFQEDFIELEIADNGIGFEPSAVSREEGQRPKLGLEGMRERAAAIGGYLELISVPSSGTTIRAKLPLGGDCYGKPK